MAITSDPFERHFARELLTSELNLLEATVAHEVFPTPDVSNLKKRIASYVYLNVGLFAAFVISAVLGTSAGILTLNALNISSSVASVIGAGVFLIFGVICVAAWVSLKKCYGK